MLRRFADSVYQQLLSTFPSGHPYPRSSFDREGMPDPIVEYLVQALETRLEVEVSRVRQLSSPWFDAEHTEVRNALNALATALSRRGQFPSDEWEAALERAVRNVVSYHVRPARTLLDFLFARESDFYTHAGLQRKLAFFQPYPYLSEVLDEYVRQRRPEEIGRDAVAALLSRIDEQMAEEGDASAWLKLLDPLFEIAAVLPAYRDGVPVELLINFFRDRGIGQIERKLERLHEVEGVDVMRRDELQQILQERPEQAVRPAPVVRHERIVTPDAAPGRAAPQAAPQTAPLPPTTQHGPIPLWQRFQQGPNAETTPLHQRVQPSRVPPRQEAQHEARPLWMRFSEGRVAPAPLQPPVSIQADPSLGDLEHSVLGERAAHDRDLYVKVLFRGSREEYESALERLAHATSWSEASRIIADEVFRPHQVNIYSDAAVSFTNAVEARFQTS